jgi:hypothetical protein
MANTTYLQIVNNVLTRLRETEVTSVADTPYSSLIGVFVNDAKREVENAYDWNALDTTITLATVAGQRAYSLTGIGDRFKTQDVINDTQDIAMRPADPNWINRQYYIGTTQQAAPTFYCYRGVDSSGDTKVELFPLPDAVYNLRFELFVPQLDFSNSSDIIKVPPHLVQLLAYSKAIAERGEDGGLQASEAYQLYRLALADAIALEGSRDESGTNWTPA